MKIKGRFTIKLKLILFATSMAAILLVVGGYTYSTIERIIALGELGLAADHLEVTVLHLRKDEKDFLLQSVSDENYFGKGENEYLEDFHDEMFKAESAIKHLSENEYFSELGVRAILDNTSSHLRDYNESFKKLEQSIKERGFKDWGKVGDMREAVHSLYEGVNNVAAKIHVLNLRKHEKDFLIRADLNYQEKFNETIGKLKRNLSANEEIGVIARVDEYQTFFNQVVDITKEIGLSAEDGYRGELKEAIHNVEPELEKVLEIITEYSHTVEAKMISNLIMLIALGFLVAAVLIYFIITSITKSIGQAQVVVKSIADGNLTEDIIIHNNDEIGELLGDLKTMIEKLKEVLGFVRGAANNSSTASLEMSSSSQQLSQGATEQAATTEEVSSSMEEMVANIQQNADNAQQTEKIALKAAAEINEGSEAVNQTVDSMKLIADKISIIGEISRQTNILALNAAVEAARAGEAGKGFAVVAAEVRKLAERSQIAAAEINDVSKSSVTIAEKSGKLLTDIVPNIQKTAELVQEISAASDEQNSGAEQVNNALQELNKITQQSAAASEEMATSSEELSSQSEDLREAIEFFKFEDDKVIRKSQIKKSVTNDNKASAVKSFAEEKKKSNGVNLALENGNGNGKDKDDGYETF